MLYLGVCSVHLSAYLAGGNQYIGASMSTLGLCAALAAALSSAAAGTFTEAALKSKVKFGARAEGEGGSILYVFFF